MQQVKYVSADDRLIVALSGEIDASCSEDFYAEVLAMFEHVQRDVELDCAELAFIDSTMLGTLVKLLKHVKGAGRSLSLVNVQPRIKKLFEICALDTIMEIRS